VRALCRQAGRLHDIEVVHLLTFGIADYVDDDFLGHFRHNAYFIGGNVRKAVQEGRADYTPIFLHEIPELMRSGQRPTDVALLQVTPPDRHGYCSLGIHVDIQMAAIETAKLLIAEVNPNMPRTFGDSIVHISRFDSLVEVDTPLLELPSLEPDETSIRIGGNIADLIEHGSTLQLGIGNIPNAVLKFMTEKRHLGIHTEMISDGCISLIENGNIDNSRKTLHRGKTIVSFIMGTRKLYDLVDDNPSIEFYPSDYANDPRVICRNDKMVAINSALQVDLTGQVCSDSIGYKFYSGIGGQVDFIRGAAMSKNGKPIIALPSTAKGGAISRIVPTLDEGAGVVTSRGDVHYVVTEYGIAYLHGKTIRERALALINIAHPDYRGELLDFVRTKHYVQADEAVWRQITEPFPLDWVESKKFGEHELMIRPIRADDERKLQEFFYSHEPETIYQRYFHMKTQLGHEEAAMACSVDYHDRMAFAVFKRFEREAEKIVGIGRYDLNHRTNMAETAFVVHEDFRGIGIGTYLLDRIIEYAKAQGIAGIQSEVLASNRPALDMHERLGHKMEYDEEDKIYRIEHRWDKQRPPRRGREPHERASR
jgi:acyl-CoA hydrolase/GNAT superfamily N-acetyltransferase